MNTIRVIAGGQKRVPFTKSLMAAAVCVALLATSAQAQFQWAKRIASSSSLPSGDPDIGMCLDTNGNCYVTGWFYGTNNFGGITLTNQSVGSSDIFLAKYNATGALQWAQRAGGTTNNIGRAVGADTNGNIYVTGGYSGAAKFGGLTLPSTSGEELFLAKYNANGEVQWVQTCTNGSSSVDGMGLAVDGAGNSYALVVVDYLGGAGTSITFGSINVNVPANGSTTLTILVKYDNTGTVQWAQLFDSSQESFATKLAVDAAGNVYVRGTFTSDMTIETSNLVVSAGSTKNMFIAKFNNSGTLTWVQQPQGGDVDEGGVAVDLAENVYVTGAFDSNLDFGGGITLTNVATDAPFGDAFVAKYNNAGAIQWAQSAGGTSGGFYWDVALDAQTNIYPAGFMNTGAAVAKYNPAGMLQWTESASGPPASPVASLGAKCAVDSTGNCYVAGLYQGTATFGTTVLHPQGAWNFFLSKVTSPADTNAPVLNIIAPTSGQHWSNAAFTVTGTARDNVQVSNVWFQINGTGWQLATTTNNWTNWTASVTLTPGTNLVSAYAEDAAGNVSATKSQQIVYVVYAPISLIVAGDGTLSGATNGQSFQLGKNVALTAKPATGCILTNWLVTVDAATVLSTNKPVPFLMQSNLVLTATFADVTPPAVKIIEPTASHLTNGLVTVQVQATDNVGVAAMWNFF